MPHVHVVMNPQPNLTLVLAVIVMVHTTVVWLLTTYKTLKSWVATLPEGSVTRLGRANARMVEPFGGGGGWGGGGEGGGEVGRVGWRQTGGWDGGRVGWRWRGGA